MYYGNRFNKCFRDTVNPLAVRIKQVLTLKTFFSLIFNLQKLADKFVHNKMHVHLFDKILKRVNQLLYKIE